MFPTESFSAPIGGPMLFKEYCRHTTEKGEKRHKLRIILYITCLFPTVIVFPIPVELRLTEIRRSLMGLRSSFF